MATNALRICNPLNIETTLMRELNSEHKGTKTLSPDGPVGPDTKSLPDSVHGFHPVSFTQLLPKKTTELEIYKPRPSVGISDPVSLLFED